MGKQSKANRKRLFSCSTKEPQMCLSAFCNMYSVSQICHYVNNIADAVQSNVLSMSTLHSQYHHFNCGAGSAYFFLFTLNIYVCRLVR